MNKPFQKTSADQRDLQRHFAQYTEITAGTPPPSSFFKDLCHARASGRTAMDSLALAFIEGAPPYEGAFAADVDLLNGPIVHLQQAAALAIAMKDDPGRLMSGLKSLFNVQDAVEMRALLISPLYLGALDRIWQSHFALIIISGYDAALLAQLRNRLLAAHLLSYLFAMPSDPARPEEVTAAVLNDLIAASIILPEAVFPLPPAEVSPAM